MLWKFDISFDTTVQHYTHNFLSSACNVSAGYRFVWLLYMEDHMTAGWQRLFPDIEAGEDLNPFSEKNIWGLSLSL